MKKIILLLILVAGVLQLDAQITFPALKISPPYPKQNSPLTFEYNKHYSSLIQQTNVDIVVYQFSNKGLKVTEPAVEEKKGVYTGRIVLDSITTCIAFGFSYDKEKDINNGKGYIIPVYDKNNVPVDGYYLTASNLQNGQGEFLFGLPVDAERGHQYLEEGIKQSPQLKKDHVFLNTYLGSIGKRKREEAPSIIAGELATFESKGSLTEQDYNFLIQWYSKNKRKDKADSLTKSMKSSFPEGQWVKGEALQPLFTAKSTEDKVKTFNAFIDKYPPTEKDKQMMDYFKAQIANGYAAEKNYIAYAQWNNMLDKAGTAVNNNNLAWNMAESGENLQEAKKMAYDATAYAKKEMLDPSNKKPEGITTKQWEAERKNNYAMFGDTYAFILYKLGEYETGFPIAKEAATINKLKDAEYNERYAMLAEKVLTTGNAKKLIEQFVRDGVASSKTKDALKNLYIKENKGDNGYDQYLAGLEAAAKIKKREEIAKKIINEPSPQFNLKDFEGKSVSLQDLKGKVVVVDFWATWCGPCIASMPGMNKALTKFKDNEDVKFLFVDTWETAEDKLKNAKDFISKKNYPFHVLMDNENKMVESFKVSGIPTKYIIDKAGRIRFKSVGFEGNDDSLVDEVTTMIEIAAK